MSRRRVNRAERDGQRQRRTADRDRREAIRRGQSAERRGLERWANPYTLMRARAWAYGFALSHTKQGPCTGCEQCGEGTLVPMSYAAWVSRDTTDDR
jgi:hypothetical protein